MTNVYECAIIGGGIAGLQAAVQLGRYRHTVVVIDAGDGRSTLCRQYHNLLGYPDGISGEALRRAGRVQAERLGAAFVDGTAVTVVRETPAGGGTPADAVFIVRLADGAEVRALRLLIASGVKDRMPDWPGLRPCLGLSVFICPDCDGYETAGRRVLVFGSGNAGAHMAVELTGWTRDILYINHERKRPDAAETVKLAEAGITVIEQPVAELLTDGGLLQGVRLADGSRIDGERAFLAFGGNEVRSSLAKMLGAKLTSGGHIENDPRTKLTSVPHVWAAGDVTVHSEQAAIAMGDGLQAAIWMHKSLTVREPLPLT